MKATSSASTTTFTVPAEMMWQEPEPDEPEDRWLALLRERSVLSEQERAAALHAAADAIESGDRREALRQSCRGLRMSWNGLVLGLSIAAVERARGKGRA